VNRAQRGVLSAALLVFGGMLAGMVLTLASIRIGEPGRIEYGIVIPSGMAFVAISLGLFIRVGDPRPQRAPTTTAPSSN